MPIARYHYQRTVKRGSWEPRFTRQRQNWRGSTKAAATPTVSSISPTTAVKGVSSLTVTVTGTGFVDGVSTIMLNGDDAVTTYVSATSLTAVIPTDMLDTAGTITVSVHSGLLVAPTPATFTISAGTTPVLTSISPTTVAHGAGNTTVTCTGTGYATGITTATLNGNDVTTTFVSATSVTAVVPSTMLGAAGSVSVNVRNGSTFASAKTLTIT